MPPIVPHQTSCLFSHRHAYVCPHVIHQHTHTRCSPRSRSRVRTSTLPSHAHCMLHMHAPLLDNTLHSSCRRSSMSTRTACSLLFKSMLLCVQLHTATATCEIHILTQTSPDTHTHIAMSAKTFLLASLLTLSPWTVMARKWQQHQLSPIHRQHADLHSF